MSTTRPKDIKVMESLTVAINMATPTTPVARRETVLLLIPSWEKIDGA